MIVAADNLESWQPSTPAQLTSDDLAPALALAPEVVLIGTGTERVLPDIELMAALGSHGVGLEIMSTPAACRTYNVLVHEGRRVVAALVNFPADSAR